jgi:RNA polymerase sigma-70 factor (ECF subfamily)
MASPGNEAFEAERSRLTGLAYRMLGSRAEAEDVVQDAWLRWNRTDRGKIRSPGAWLTTTVTRLAIDRLRSVRARRETYVGPWLPEPLVEAQGGALGQAPDPAAFGDGLGDISLALMLVLERLTPAERAAFLLHDVFDYDYDELADILERAEPACRKLVSRARAHVRAERPRFEAAPEARARLFGAFVEAVQAGELSGLVSLLAEDATLLADGGGKARAALNPILGADNVARFLLGTAEKFGQARTYRPVMVNGEPGIAGYTDGALEFVATIAGDGERITAIHLVVNPDKLAGAQI